MVRKGGKETLRDGGPISRSIDEGDPLWAPEDQRPRAGIEHTQSKKTTRHRGLNKGENGQEAIDRGEGHNDEAICPYQMEEHLSDRNQRPTSPEMIWD